MKTVFITGILAAGILLSGCETTVVEHRYHRGGYGYYGEYREPVYRESYGGGYYRTRNVDRTNVYERNVYETNVHRNTVDRSRSRTERVTSNPRVQTRTRANVTTQTTTNTSTGKHSKRDKKHTADELTH